jgi:uncharacterized membrane protein YeaQ/YmgE (transglycosylase-associated protein family)
MTLVGFLLLVLVGAICGAIAQFIVGWSRGGFILATLVGFAGALIGNWGAPLIHLPTIYIVRVDGYTIEVVWAILGAVALLLVLSLFRRSTYSRWRHAP